MACRACSGAQPRQDHGRVVLLAGVLRSSPSRRMDRRDQRSHVRVSGGATPRRPAPCSSALARADSARCRSRGRAGLAPLEAVRPRPFREHEPSRSTANWRRRAYMLAPASRRPVRASGRRTWLSRSKRRAIRARTPFARARRRIVGAARAGRLGCRMARRSSWRGAHSWRRCPRRTPPSTRPPLRCWPLVARDCDPRRSYGWRTRDHPPSSRFRGSVAGESRCRKPPARRRFGPGSPDTLGATRLQATRQQHSRWTRRKAMARPRPLHSRSERYRAPAARAVRERTTR